MLQRIGALVAGQAGATGNGQQKALDKACEEMEALFLKQLLSEMRRASGTTLRGPGGEIYQELFDQELARHLAGASDLGLARMVQQQLQRSAAPASPQQIPGGAGAVEPNRSRPI
ncbi:MAG TPA: rod-binding protein [Armatimonadota bacterium]|jgi:flagellar protein FlgJ|nr:rod-binding protein [Armatimonadota bacterium]HOJ22431.1 rod-binding protein [Armatimonadota bacterium]HOM81388.1 rod-binding protein [Armatimonadota bacterium]HOQ27401.1 rod-binding protein [Armatimonadota bacterium]HPO72819.1 rod-binding protein [Armatimonadota bacterium]